MQGFINYILSLGGMVFVPIVLILVALLFRLSFLKSIKAGVTAGVGFLGMNLVVGVVVQYLNPAVDIMVKRFGLNLNVIDVGSGTASGVGYATAVGALVIPVIFVLNIVLLFLRVTKTMNIDIYNYWHYSITGSIVYLMTGSLVFGLAGAMFHAAFCLISADFTAKRVQNIIGIDGISICQGYGASTVPLFYLLECLYNKIPFMKNKKIDSQFIQKKFGMIGDPVIIGIALGILFSLLAGYGLRDALTLIIAVVGIMILFPRMIKIIVEGLLPISEAAKKFFNKHFQGKEFYIGMDSAVTLGHPTTISVGIILIPIMILIAAILPGNTVLPLADLPFAPFFICMATVIHKGDMLRTLISSVINMVIVLLIASYFAPYFTQMAVDGQLGLTQGDAKISALAVGNVFDWVITQFMRFGIIGIVCLLALAAGAVYYNRKKALAD